MDLLAQPTLRTNAEAIADDEWRWLLSNDLSSGSTDRRFNKE
jgi:hypothetical protein